MRNAISRRIALAFSLALLSFPAQGQVRGGRAQGAIVVSESANVYRNSDGDAVEAVVSRGDFVGSITGSELLSAQYLLDEVNGRVHVMYFKNKEQKGTMFTAWMNPADLAPFFYECGCGPEGKECAPYQLKFMSRRWNACYVEARDKKLAELKDNWATGGVAETNPSPTAPPAKTAPVDRPLSNADIINMTTAGLDEALIISKVEKSSAETLDSSPDGLVALKKAGVAKAVIAAVSRRVEARQ